MSKTGKRYLVLPCLVLTCQEKNNKKKRLFCSLYYEYFTTKILQTTQAKYANEGTEA